MKRVHVWKEYRDVGLGSASWSWCGTTILKGDPKGPDGMHPEARRLEGATCMVCVRKVRDDVLWRLQFDTRTAHASSELLDELIRANAKVKAKAKRRKQGVVS